MRVCVCVYLYVYRYMHIGVYICIYIYICSYMYTHIYIHIYIHAYHHVCSFCTFFYLQEQRVRGLAEGLRASKLSGAEELSQLLMSGGVRAAVENAERMRGDAVRPVS